MSYKTKRTCHFDSVLFLDSIFFFDFTAKQDKNIEKENDFLLCADWSITD